MVNDKILAFSPLIKQSADIAREQNKLMIEYIMKLSQLLMTRKGRKASWDVKRDAGSYGELDAFEIYCSVIDYLQDNPERYGGVSEIADVEEYTNYLKSSEDKFKEVEGGG